jgi:sigma-E factor negative regulatory protein RseB
MVPKGFSGVVTLVLLVVQLPAGAEQVDGREWLQRMSMAARSLNYIGTFVYENQGKLEAMRIVHAMDEDGEREHLMSLTGPEREVLRDNQIVTCILGDRHAVHVNKSRPRKSFQFSLPGQLEQLEQHYSFEVGGEDRVAGKHCRVVVVSPRDNLRYGRRMCVHEKSHLVLRSELTGAGDAVVEQVMFTSVEFPERIDEAALLPDINGADYTWRREPDQQPDKTGKVADSRWKVAEVPEGFMLTDHNWHSFSVDRPGVEHWVYSDGLASVSVYIEAARTRDTYNGVSRRGALNAFGTMVDDYYVTVVGEVPGRTVEMIGRSVSSK